jgi:hypothetical protein
MRLLFDEHVSARKIGKFLREAVMAKADSSSAASTACSSNVTSTPRGGTSPKL